SGRPIPLRGWRPRLWGGLRQHAQAERARLGVPSGQFRQILYFWRLEPVAANSFLARASRRGKGFRYSLRQGAPRRLQPSLEIQRTPPRSIRRESLAARIPWT